jgi:hypothetical protein
LIAVGLLFSLRSRRTIADFVAGTLVVNTPPLQPHRAPAAPMYSAGDAEFGYAPRKPKGTREDARRIKNLQFQDASIWHRRRTPPDIMRR